MVCIPMATRWHAVSLLPTNWTLSSLNWASLWLTRFYSLIAVISVRSCNCVSTSQIAGALLKASHTLLEAVLWATSRVFCHQVPRQSLIHIAGTYLRSFGCWHALVAYHETSSIEP